MTTIETQPRYLFLLAVPFLVVAARVVCLVFLAVIREVVPSVVRAVLGA